MSNIYKEEIDKKELYLPLSIDEYISEGCNLKNTKPIYFP